jgi:Zn-finger nucleic acid-binding protein
VWLDQGEIERMIGAASESQTAPPMEKMKRAPLDRLVGSCPSCRIGLSSYEVPDQPASLEVCPRCHGMWFDRGELRLLREGAVVIWLRKLLASLPPPEKRD